MAASGAYHQAAVHDSARKKRRKKKKETKNACVSLSKAALKISRAGKHRRQENREKPRCALLPCVTYEGHLTLKPLAPFSGPRWKRSIRARPLFFSRAFQAAFNKIVEGCGPRTKRCRHRLLMLMNRVIKTSECRHRVIMESAGSQHSLSSGEDCGVRQHDQILMTSLSSVICY